MYQIAWKLLIKRIETKNSWGKNELQKLMLQCLSGLIEETK